MDIIENSWACTDEMLKIRCLWALGNDDFMFSAFDAWIFIENSIKQLKSVGE